MTIKPEALASARKLRDALVRDSREQLAEESVARNVEIGRDFVQRMQYEGA
jgi:hypothetical protein